MDVGDWVVVVNAKDVAFSGAPAIADPHPIATAAALLLCAPTHCITGKKSKEKLYRWHTGYPGGLKTLTARQVFERAPERVLEKAVLGMLPKSKLKSTWAKKLRIFPGEEHTHEANVAGSRAYAPDFLDAYKPRSVELREKEETGHFVVDYEPEDGEEMVEVDLRAEWEAAMAAEAAAQADTDAAER